MKATTTRRSSLCGRLGVRHFSRKGRPEYLTEHGQFQRGTKHGNYNAWLSETGFATYDVLAAIDPDHVPASNFLTETLGQLSDPRIAYVQSPQEYYNAPASLIARGCSEESLDFYWISQRAFHRFGSPSVIGAHGVHRMQALQAMGGLAPHIADDLLLTLRYQMSGWRGAYVAKVLARGLAPVDWPTYLKQQRRWATALFDVKFFLYPRLVQGMPLRSRVVGFLQGLTFLQDSAAALCCAMALAAILIAGVPASFASVATSSSRLNKRDDSSADGPISASLPWSTPQRHFLLACRPPAAGEMAVHAAGVGRCDPAPRPRLCIDREGWASCFCRSVVFLAASGHMRLGWRNLDRGNGPRQFPGSFAACGGGHCDAAVAVPSRQQFYLGASSVRPRVGRQAC